MDLGFGRSRFHFAGPAGRYSSLEDLEGLRIATSYVGVVEDYLFRHGIDATVTRLDGAVETSIQLGVADVIADVVETGSTLRAAGPGDLRRGHPRLRGGADHPRRRGARRLRDLPSPASRASWSPAAT